jgi:hypothetical protein
LPKTGRRQKGVANKRTREIADAAVREGLTPLEYMLDVLRDEKADPDRRDRMATAATPYIHPRLSNVEARVGGDPENPIGLSIKAKVELARAAIAEAFAEVVRERESEG